jgi:hypothetical protein
MPSDDLLSRKPITGIVGCCARTASGHAAAVVFLAGNPLFADSERNIAITKQACADVVVVGIDPEG